MNKHKLTNKEILHIVIISIIYVTWIVSIHVLMAISENKDNYIIYTNLVGSAMALFFTIMLHYPLIPIFSRYINARTENDAVKIRRNYAIKALYTLVIGFFACAFMLFLDVRNFEKYPLASSWGLLGFTATVMMTTFAIFTIQYWKKMKILMYVDKLQHKNADIES